MRKIHWVDTTSLHLIMVVNLPDTHFALHLATAVDFRTGRRNSRTSTKQDKWRQAQNRQVFHKNFPSCLRVVVALSNLIILLAFSPENSAKIFLKMQRS